MKLAFFLCFFTLHASVTYGQEDFIVIDKSNGFVLNDQPYRFIGTNLWFGLYLGVPGDSTGRHRLVRELDRLEALGVKNLRVLGASEGTGKYQVEPTIQPTQGVYDQQLLTGLDFLLDEMSKREMKAVVVLNNFWMWSGGMPQYVSWAEGTQIPYPDIENGGSWDDFIGYSLSFFTNSKAQRYFRQYIKTLLERTNSINGRVFKEDPTIMSWQLCNEPRGYQQQEAYLKWIKKTAGLIKRKDKNHLVSLGAEGNTSSDDAGVDLYRDNAFKHIDYATVHLWIQNWGWFDPQNPHSFQDALKSSRGYLDGQVVKALKLNKPMVIEEFGVSRDGGSFDPDAGTSHRNDFYKFLFDYVIESIREGGLVQGCNFWGWAGEARPVNPGMLWQQGEPFTGDPPHEGQGWYSVYNDDTTTIEIIEGYQIQLQKALEEKYLNTNQAHMSGSD